MQDIEILFQNENILIINKPKGITVNKSNTTKDTLTVQDYLIENFPQHYENQSQTTATQVLITEENEDLILEESDNNVKDPVLSIEPNKMDAEDDVISDFYSRNGIVHRLDKDTSGVLVVALNEPSFKFLQGQFKAREVTKSYFAYAIGEIVDERFEINAPLARNPKNRMKMAVIPTGKSAVTLVEKDHVFELEGTKYTALRVFPKTGRTHQIRVHLAALNHPIAGDYIYAGQRRGPTTRELFGRLMLHAHKIAFKMPVTEEIQEFEAPIPDEFAY